MEETAVYFEDSLTQSVDITGCGHMVMKSTGFASIRITALISIWADGQQASPTIIHKGAKNGAIQRQIGPILYRSEPKA